jgi:hypothetical protein
METLPVLLGHITLRGAENAKFLGKLLHLYTQWDFILFVYPDK